MLIQKRVSNSRMMTKVLHCGLDISWYSNNATMSPFGVLPSEKVRRH